MHEAFRAMSPGTPGFAFMLAALEALPRKKREALIIGALNDLRTPLTARPVWCSMAVAEKLRALPRPRDMLPAEKMAARAILSECKACMGCERAL